jgi:TolA-binding protein
MKVATTKPIRGVMDCPEIGRDDLLEKYLRGELGPAQRDELETHILECAGCLQALEAFQVVWDDLTQRAHEIRVAPPVRRVGFRWTWAAATVVAIAVALGLYQLDRRTLRANLHRQTPSSPEKPATPAQPAQEATANSVPTSEAPKPQHQSKPKGTQTANEAPPLTPSSQQAKKEDSAVPAVIPTPSAASKEIGIATAGIQPQATPLPQLASNESSSDEVAKELFRLGVVQPPPYTFSGFVGSSKVKSPKTRTPRNGGLGAAGSNGDGAKTPAADLGRADFQNAMDAYVEKRYAAAAALLEEAVSVEPNASDAHFFLGICRLLNAKPAEAIPPLKTALANEKSPYLQAAHFYLAKAYVQTGDLSQAETELRTAADLSGRLTTQASSLLTRLQAVRALQKGAAQKEERKQPPPGPS